MKRNFSFCFILLQLLICHVSLSQWVQTSGLVGGYTDDIVEINSILFVSGGNGGVFKSSDNGESWSLVINGLPTKPSIQALRKDGETLYTSIYQNGIYVSENMGEDWTPINTGIDKLTFYNFEAKDDELYAGNANGGIYYSSNKGASWANRSTDISDIQFQDFVFFDSKIYAAGDSLYESSDNGNSWKSVEINNQTLSGIESVAVSKNVFYAANYKGVFTSKDSTKTWNQAPLTTNASVTSISVLENKVYLSTSEGRVFYTVDEGESWTLIQNSSIRGMVHSALFLGDQIFMSSNTGLYKSSDSGKSFYRINTGQIWTDINSGINNLQVVSLNANSGYLFAGSESQGVFRSADSGETWESFNIGLEAINSDNTRDIISIGNKIILGSGGPLYTTTHNGGYWEEVYDPGVNRSISASGFDEGLFAFGVNGVGVYTSTDSLKSWNLASTKNLNIDTDYMSLEVVGDSIFVGTGDGEVYLSPDKGQNWSDLAKSENLSWINSIEVYDEKLYVATWTGLFTYQNSIWADGFANQVPVHDILVHTNILFLATSGGMVFKAPNSNSWHDQSLGFNGNILTTLAIDNGYLFAGTFASSVWKLPTSELEFTEITSVSRGFDLNNQTTIYPNPVNNILNINLNNDYLGRVSFSLFSLDGKLQHSGAVSKDGNKKQGNINLSSVPSGIYFLQIGYSNKFTSRTVRVQH